MRNIIIWTGAYVDLKEVRKSKSTATKPAVSATTPSITLKTDVIFKVIGERIGENVEKAKAVNGIFLYNITKDGQIAKKWSKFI